MASKKSTKSTAKETPAVSGKTKSTGTVIQMENFMAQGKSQMDKCSADLAALGEAYTKSGKILASGLEEYTSALMALMQASAEKNAQAVKTLLGSRTLNELTEAQNKIAQQGFDDFMSGMTKLSELSVKLATESFEPINDQISKTVKKATAA